MSRPPDISVVIPVFNRGELVRHTLASVRAASAGIEVEIVAVDDGSATPLADDLARLGLRVDRLVRQENRGLLFARLAGLEAASGRLVLFLDSDDLVSTDKLRLHVDAMRDGACDITYTDSAEVALDGHGGPSGPVVPHPPLAEATDATGFGLLVKPAPHCPVYDAAWLRRVVAAPGFAPRPFFNPVAEIWYYHKGAVHPGRVRRLPGPHAIVGQHSRGRITDRWERLGVASLSVMEHFFADPPAGPRLREARARVSANAFAAWRRHPWGMPPALQRRFLRVWRAGRDPALAPEGTAGFRRLASLVGALPAAWLLRRLRNPAYRRIRTLDARALDALLASTPSPLR